MKVKQQHLSLPLSVQFEITNSCNHKCPHCYILSDTKKGGIKNCDESTILRIAAKIIENKIFNVIVTGGEPLKKEKTCKKVISLFKSNGIYTALNTNLTLLDDEFILFLKKVSIDSILTSCPSSDSSIYEKMVGVDNFSIFINNLAKINDAKLKSTVNMVITKNNINEIYSTALMLKEVGCKSFAATPMGFNVINPHHELFLNSDEVGFVVSELIQISEKLKMNVDIVESIPKCLFQESLLDKRYNFLNRKCSAGRTVAAISCNGDVRPCSHNMQSYGNILQDDFVTIWKQMKDWRANKYLPDNCKRCTWVNKCNGGCRINAKVYNGNWDSEDPWMLTPFSKNLTNNPFEKLKGNVTLRVCQDFKHRKESDDSFLIIYEKQYILVNKLLFDLIVDLRRFTDIGINDIAKRYKTDMNDEAFQKTMKFLISKNLLSII